MQGERRRSCVALYNDAKKEAEHLEIARKSNELWRLADALNRSAQYFTHSTKRSLFLLSGMIGVIVAQQTLESETFNILTTIPLNTTGGVLLGETIQVATKLSRWNEKRAMRNRFNKPEKSATEGERHWEVRQKLADGLSTNYEEPVAHGEVERWIKKDRISTPFYKDERVEYAKSIPEKIGRGKTEDEAKDESVILFMEAQRDAQERKRNISRLMQEATRTFSDTGVGVGVIFGAYVAIGKTLGHDYAMLASVLDDFIPAGAVIVSTPLKKLFSTQTVQEAMDKMKNLRHKKTKV